MKANANFNTSLFRKFDLSTTSISGGTMICHPVKATGNYSGTVLKDNVEVGGFVLDCSDDAAELQADIDLSSINHRTKQDDCHSCETKSFKIRTGGYAVFYTSFGEGNYQVTLTNQEKVRQPANYSTEKLEKGDIVVFMLLRPGTYEAYGSKNQKCRISVGAVDRERTEEYNKVLMTPSNLSIDEEKFSIKEVSIMPGQGIVINLETEGSMSLRLVEAREVEISTDKKKRRWENRKYKK